LKAKIVTRFSVLPRRHFASTLAHIIIVVLLLAGCSPSVLPAGQRSAEINPGPDLSLPTAPPTGQPTPTATVVATYEATGTPTPTATWPAATATPTATLTAEPPPPSATPAPPQTTHVVIISLDGLRPDALAQADTPTLDRLIAAGAFSPAARAVLPSVTLINHASMLGGMTPEKHGILWNDYEPERGKINGPTLFSVAHQAGLSTAMIVGKDKLEHIVLPNSVDIYDYAGYNDAQVTTRALEVIGAGLPDILFVHLPDIDSVGHAAGWMSATQLDTIAQTDSLVAQIVDALEGGGYFSQTLLLITADHGGQETGHGGDSPAEMTIPWLAVGPGVPAGTALTAPITVYDTAATALYALTLPRPSSWDGQPVVDIFPAQP